jgi:hypothetical protein
LRSLEAAAKGGVLGERMRKGAPAMTWHLVGMVLVLLLGVTATVIFFGATLSFILKAPAQTVPGCPDGSSLYTRTAVHGTVALPIQHCFRDNDARDMQPAY